MLCTLKQATQLNFLSNLFRALIPATQLHTNPNVAISIKSPPCLGGGVHGRTLGDRPLGVRPVGMSPVGPNGGRHGPGREAPTRTWQAEVAATAAPAKAKPAAARSVAGKKTPRRHKKRRKLCRDFERRALKLARDEAAKCWQNGETCDIAPFCDAMCVPMRNMYRRTRRIFEAR